MTNEEKEYEMKRFVDGIKYLVATTVIEVGVNVPNASVMIMKVLNDSDFSATPT